MQFLFLKMKIKYKLSPVESNNLLRGWHCQSMKHNVQHLMSKNIIRTIFVLLISETEVHVWCHSYLQTNQFLSVITSMNYFSHRTALINSCNNTWSISTARLVHIKKCHEYIQVLLAAIRYSEYNWNICGDLNGIGMLMEIQ